MKQLIERLIKMRNPSFAFHPKVDGRMIFSLMSNLFIGHLRSYKLLMYGSMPLKSIVGANVKTKFQHKITWGKQMKLGDHVLLSGLGTEGIIFGNNVSIGDYSRLIVSTTFNDLGKFIKIGNNVGMGEFAYLGGAAGLEIGDDCIIGQYLSCHPENHNFEINNDLIRMQGTTRKGIKIGKNCWIGSKVTVLDGVEIGDSCVIAAGCVVNKSFPSRSVIGGVPAKLLKSY